MAESDQFCKMRYLVVTLSLVFSLFQSSLSEIIFEERFEGTPVHLFGPCFFSLHSFWLLCFLVQSCLDCKNLTEKAEICLPLRHYVHL